MNFSIIIAICCIICLFIGFVWGNVHMYKREYEAIRNATYGQKKYQKMFKLAMKWFDLDKTGKSLTEYLYNDGFRTVALYGYGVYGKRLISEIEASSMKLEYIIDRYPEKIKNYKALSPEENLPEVDAIIVTAISDYFEIAEKLGPKGKFKVLSLEDIIYEAEYYEQFD